MTKYRKSQLAALIVALCLSAAVTQTACSREKPAPSTTIPNITVRFGMLPYGDHTYAIIGAQKGWFSDVGINLDYRTVKVEDTVPFLRNGSLDVGSCSPGIIIAAHPSGPPIVNFVFGDIFQGYAIMAQPQRGFKSAAEFMKSGMPADQAVQAAVAQIKGKTFAYPSEVAIKPFIDLALQKGMITRKDFKSLVLDDPLTVNAMRNHQADFQVGGVPSHLVLEREGFVPIVTSNDLASAATPSPQSEELSSIFTDGWASTRQYYDQNRATVLRLAGVNFRIMKFIKEHADEALAIHMPYLSQVTGQTFTPAEGRVIYGSLDPFFTFEEQRDWYHNSNSPYYYKHMNGAIINSFVKQGVFKSVTVPEVTDVNVANEVYDTLADLKTKAELALAQLERGSAIRADLKAQVAEARRHYDAYNFYDAERLATAALARAAK